MREREREKDGQTEGERERERDGQIEGEREREREMDRQKERERTCNKMSQNAGYLFLSLHCYLGLIPEMAICEEDLQSYIQRMRYTLYYNYQYM